MTDLQRVELNILRAVIDACESLNIRYYLVCGSALGAVKYNGFIPWDDDVDIGMFREDYERFLREAPALLPPHLFVQNFRTDKKFAQIYSKIRDSRTTYIETSSKHLPIHHGVYIDVFPLDGYPGEKARQVGFDRKKRMFTFLCNCHFNFKRSAKATIVTGALRLCGVRRMTGRIVRGFDSLIRAYDTASSEIICNHGNWQGKLEYAPKWHYGEGTMVTFEGVTVRVPEHYDEYLTQKYGDWRADLPEDQKVGHHYYEICDLERPYTEYVPSNKAK